MSVKVLEGKPVAEAVLEDVAARVSALKKKGIEEKRHHSWPWHHSGG
jgi:hypothetical protein